MEITPAVSEHPVVWPASYNEVPKEVFVRADIFDEELRRIFYGAEWHPVAHEGELPNPGDFKTFLIGRVPLLITRAADGEILLGDAEPVFRFAKNGEPRRRCLAERPLVEENAARRLRAPANASAQLMELGEPEALRVLDDHDGGVGRVDADLDDCRCN